ncbi:TetR/AcrR family transcriptional regulator [Kribbella pittospori]|uniref:TetR/AcrR family transcriptional regulator n=1 Tax=Kribbella pittospori TaxID=722689 RepID=UPI0013F46D95|nr:TetR/AcrR family transcriptional regulator [Kribbella pittospori]
MATHGRRAAATAGTRRGIIEAARELLATREWQHFTIEAVASRAGVTRVTVYNQVRSKRGLLDAVLADLVDRAGMDQLLADTEHLSAGDACAEIVRRTCLFWHSERRLLRPLFGLAAVDHDVASILTQREEWRGNQMQRLVGRLTAETTSEPSLDQADVLAGVTAVTSFATYDALGAIADDPDRAAVLLNRVVRSLTG